MNIARAIRISILRYLLQEHEDYLSRLQQGINQNQLPCKLSSNYSETKLLSLTHSFSFFSFCSLFLSLSFFLAYTGNISVFLFGICFFFFFACTLQGNFRDYLWKKYIIVFADGERERGLYNIYNILSLYNYT